MAIGLHFAASLLVKAGKTGAHCWFFLLANRSIEHLLSWVIEITEAICLEPIGDDRKQQMPCQMSRSPSLKHALPAST